MRLSCIVCTVVVAGLAMPATAEYVSIQHNLFDGVFDSSYTGGTLLVSGDSDLVTLQEDTGNLPGTITNAHVELDTSFSHVYMDGPDVKAVFVGGDYLLTFDYDASPYSFGGPILGMEFLFTELSPTVGRIDGEGLFTALTQNLPGSGIWPDGGGFSSLDTLTLTFDTPTGWDWNTDFEQGETTYSVIPDDSAVPEPATLVLLGVLGLLHRRRR